MSSTFRSLRFSPATRGAFCALFIAACCGQSFAAGPLASDPAAYNDGSSVWSGTVTIPAALQALRVDVDYAVYAPGTLGNSALFDLSDVADAATEYVYVYQIDNTIGGTAALTQLTVGLSDLLFFSQPSLNDGFDVELPSNDGWITGFTDSVGDPTYVPALSQITPDDIDRDPLAEGISWEFNSGAGIPAGLAAAGGLGGGVSTMLAFTSTGAPEWDFASILGGGFGGTGILPSPTAAVINPEPSSLVLALMAASMGFVGRRRRY